MFSISKALFISLSIHTAIILLLLVINLPFIFSQKPRDKVKLSIKILPQKNNVATTRTAAAQMPVDITSRPTTPKTIPAKLVKTGVQVKGMPVMHKATSWRPKDGKAVMIRPINNQKINNPAYAAYNEMVRSRIEQKVYDNYDKSEIGSVYLTFIVDASGRLQASQVIVEKTTGSKHLQDISLISLEQASPFPHFIDGMNLPEYSFNIEIQYQLDN